MEIKKIVQETIFTVETDEGDFVRFGKNDWYGVAARNLYVAKKHYKELEEAFQNESIKWMFCEKCGMLTTTDINSHKVRCEICKRCFI